LESSGLNVYKVKYAGSASREDREAVFRLYVESKGGSAPDGSDVLGFVLGISADKQARIQQEI
jgi:hypothetical protein